MAAPQLRLEVSLNLAGFRNEMRRLTQVAQSEFNPLLKVNIDVKDYRAQLRQLEKIKPVIKIEDSQIDGARARLASLNKSLATLRRATSTPIEIKLKYTEVGKPPSAAAGQIGRAVSGGVRGSQVLEGATRSELLNIRKMMSEAGMALGKITDLSKATASELRNSIVPAFTSSGEQAINGLAAGLADSSSKIGKIAGKVGVEAVNGIKHALGIASPSREFKKIGEAAGQGFEQGLLSSTADAFDSLERQLGTKLQRLKAQAIAGTSGALAVSGRVSPVQVADVTPRDYARIAGSGPRAALPPGVDRSAETLQNFYRSLDQIGIALASTVDSAERAADAFKTLRNAIDSLINRAKVLTGEQSLQARLRPSSVPGGMPLLTGRAPSRALPMLSAAAQRPERFTSQEKLFKDFLGRTIKAVVPEIGSAAIGRSLFGGTQFREIGNAMRRPQLGAGIDTKVETVAVKDLTIASRNIAAATNALKAQKLLPAAGGTSASQMIRQVLSGLPPLKAPQIGAQNISPRGSLGQFPMAGMMAPSSPLGSMGQFPVDPMLAVGGASAMGQKVAGPYPWSNTTRSARGGYIPGIASSLQFPMSGMMGPSSPLGRITPQSSMFAGGGGGPGGGGPGGGGLGGGGGGSFGGGGFNVPNLPGAGLVREIGTEFGFAARQVLLFGTAYKALAFIQGFPAQVGDAVGALQSFRNTLGAISPSAEEAAESSQFILDIVDKYNTPIQSARDGFTKLYASMKPTGFSGDEIRDLFLGISQAAATFGMSADKVDRVNYAFAQMASKGQVMSEELKGQLGDVLPGAMGIFAEAAGFEGPDAITKFSKALEDGAYKGGAMKTLLTNVGSIMQKEFGPGAEGAARTFQGVMNRMQNSTKLLYEAFEPVAVGFLNSVVMPLTSGLKTVTDGFNAFFTGTNAKTAGGFAFAQELEKLRPTFEGLRTNAIALAQVFGEFAKVALSVGSALLQIAGNPIVGFMAKIYAIMVPLNMALGVMRGLWALNSLQLLLFNARVAMGVPTLSAFRGMMQATGATAAVTATSIRTAGLTLRTFFASTGVGLILVGISLLIERFMSINQALADTRAKAIGAAQAIRSMTKTEAILDERKTVSAIKLLETLQTRKRSYEGSTDVSLTKSEASLLEDVGVPVNKGGVGGGQYMDPTMLESHKQRLETVNLAELRNRQRVINNDENEARQTAAITPITGGDGDAGATKIKDKQKYVSDMAKLLQQEMQQKINAINQDASISDREREIQAAATRYDYELLINKAEYSAGINDENKKDILNRGQYLADLQKTLKAENELSRQRYENVVTSPLRDMLSEDKKAIIELEAAEKMISEGRTERTYVEAREIQIKQALVGLDEKQIQVLQPLIDLILKAAAARDKLTEASKRNLAFTEKMNELRNQLALAQILDPRAERRAQIKQETPGLSDAQVESRAALEEQVAAAAKSRDQLRSIASTIGDAFGEAFKGIITGSMTAQEALAGMFQSIADSFADMVAQMIAEWLKAQLIKGFANLFGSIFGGGGGGLGSMDANIAQYASLPAGYANGGIAPGGFTAFANGGMVTGPTMGLVGEGRYNEAIVPLPDGKSIPVELAGGGSSSPTVIVNVDAKGSQVEGNEQNANQLGRVISAAVQTELIKQQRPGGLLAR